MNPQVADLLRQRDVLRAQQRALETGGGPPDPPDMDQIVTRLATVEGRLDKLDTRLEGIDTRLRAVETGIAGLNGKLDILVGQVVGKLPSWWQMPAVIGSTVGLLAALYAGVRYLQAHGLL